MQTQLAKIRSDAAECRLLSTIASTEKREMFVAMAEHLNGLALEIEKTIAASGEPLTPRDAHQPAPATIADPPVTAAQEVTDPTTARHRKPWHSRRIFPFLLVFVATFIAGALFWARPIQDRVSSMVHARPAEHPATVRNVLPTTAVSTPGSELALLQKMRDQLGSVADRVADLERQLSALKDARLETTGSVSKSAPAAADDHPRSSNTALPEEPSSPQTTNGAAQKKASSPSAAAEKPTASRANDPPSPAASGKPQPENEIASTQPDNAADGSGAVERSDAGETAGRADRHRHRLVMGPPGCRYFRSYNGASGTYIDFDGRRRRCR